MVVAELESMEGIQPSGDKTELGIQSSIMIFQIVFNLSEFLQEAKVMSWFFARGESEHRDSIFQIAFEYGGSGGGVTWIGGV